MKIITKRWFVFCAISTLCFTVSIPLVIMAERIDIPRSLRGKPFSDPSQQIRMSEEWLKKSVLKDAETISINLDQQMYRIFVPELKKYAKDQNLKLLLTDSTCGNSAGMLRRKMIDVGGFCCPVGAIDRLPGLRFHTSGITPVAFIVHPDNPINDITLEQARKIFMGDINRWSELKTEDGRYGHDVMIKVAGRLHCKTRPGHWRLLLDNEDLFSPAMVEVGTIPDMISQVASNPNAIGHVSLWLATKYYTNKGLVKPLKINGYAPDDLNALLTGEYSVYKTFNLTTWEGAEVENPDAVKFVEHLITEVENLDDSYGIISSSRLRKAGWKFKDHELIGEPN